jgi:hypothetical protein
MAVSWTAILAAATRVLAPKPPGPAEPPRYALDRALRTVRTIDRLAPLAGDTFERLELARIAALYATIANCGCHIPAGANGKLADDHAHNDAAELAADHLKNLLPPDDLDLLARILREHRRRHTDLPEARILADALCLEEFGLIGLWHQMRALHAQSKTPEQLLKLWKAQHDYGYWNTRLRDGFHYEITRTTAAARLAHMEPLFTRLQAEHLAEDLPLALAPAIASQE